MRGVAKKFYMGSWLASCSLILLFEIAAWAAGWEKGWLGWTAFNGLFVLPLLVYLGIVCLVLLYKLWAAIEDNEPSISPGRALGFILIPFFNIYWFFRVVGGFAGAFNSYIKRHSISVQPMSERLLQAFSIYVVTAVVLSMAAQVIERSIASRPMVTGALFVISAVISLIFGSFVIAEACQGVNRIVGTAGRKAQQNIQAPQEQEVSCPSCQARISAGARFCFMCGTKLEAVIPHYPAEQAAPDAPFGSDCGVKADLDADADLAPVVANSSSSPHSCDSLNSVAVEPAASQIVKPEQRFGGEQDFANYVMEAEGTNLKTINICMAVGIFVLGWLAWVVYFFLGKPYRGLIYFVPVFILFRFAMGSVPVFLLVLAIWAFAWVDASRILKKYQDSANRRLDEINLQLAPGIDLLLEKGIILQKVQGKRFEALDSFKQAMTMQGGDPVLWALAGIELVKQKSYAEANAAFDRSNGAQGGKAYHNRLRAYKKKVGKKLGITPNSHRNENMRGEL